MIKENLTKKIMKLAKMGMLTILVVWLSLGMGKSLLFSQTQEFAGKGSMLPYFFEGEKYLPGETSIRGYLSLPEKSNSKAPAIILIHEWWGLTDGIKAEADKFAEAGYVAFAVDLYKGDSSRDPAEARRLSGAVRKNLPEAFANLQAAVKFVKNHPRVDEKRIASVGWCFGGGWSYQMAKNNIGVKASVIYYGFFAPKDDLKKMRGVILGHFAENDRAIKVDTVRELQIRLKTLHGDHEIYIYANTSHGFASKRLGGNPVYKQKEADIAGSRTLLFLKKHL